MTQTPSNAPKAEIDQLKAIQDRAKEANNMALTNATAHFHKLVDEIKAFQARATTQDAKNEAGALIRAFENDIAYLKQEIQKAKTDKKAQVIKELEWVKYVIGGQKTVNTTADAAAPAATIAVAQKAPEAITVDMDAEATKYIQNFQKEAVGAFKEAIQDKNGNLTTLSLRRGLEFMQDVSKLSADWIEKDEKEVLSKHIPAVQGILGGIFMETLLRFGYAVGFNGDGNVVLKGKANVYEVQKEINDAIKRDSNLSQILRSGVLHMDGDLLKYMQSSSTSQGKGILPEQQTPVEFLKYLHNRSGETQASDIIKNSVNFFKGMDLPAQMVSANAIPEISRELKALTPEERVLIQNTVNAAATGAAASTTANGAPVMSRGEAMAQAVGAMNSGGVPTAMQDWKKNGIIGGSLNQLGHTGVVGLKEIFNSPASTSVALLAIFASFFYFGFKKTLAWIITAPFVVGLISRGVDTFKWNSRVEVPAPTPLTKEGRVAVAGNLYGTTETAKQVVDTTEPLKWANPNAVIQYMNGDKEANLTDEQKKYIDGLDNKEIVAEYVGKLRKQLLDKYMKGTDQHLSEDGKQKLADYVNSQSVENLESLIAETDEQVIKRLKNIFNPEPTGLGTPEEMKEWVNAILEFVKENKLPISVAMAVIFVALSFTMWIKQAAASVLTLGTYNLFMKWWENWKKYKAEQEAKNSEWNKANEDSKTQDSKKADNSNDSKANTNNAESKTNVDNSKAKPDTTKYRHIGAQSNNLNLDGQTQAELEKKMAQVDEKMKGSKDKMVELEKAKTIDIKKEQVEAILGEINRQKQWLEVEMNRETLLLKKNLPEHMASDIDKYISSIRDVRMQELDAMEAKAKNILDRIEKAKKASSSVLDNLDTIKTIDGVNVTLSGEKLKKYNKLQEEFKGFDKVKGVKISDNAAVNAMNEINELFKDDKLAVENINTIKQAFLDKPEKFDEFLKKILKKAG